MYVSEVVFDSFVEELLKFLQPNKPGFMIVTLCILPTNKQSFVS